jgi:hypothetical protein
LPDDAFTSFIASVISGPDPHRRPGRFIPIEPAGCRTHNQSTAAIESPSKIA